MFGLFLLNRKRVEVICVYVCESHVNPRFYDGVEDLVCLNGGSLMGERKRGES